MMTVLENFTPSASWWCFKYVALTLPLDHKWSCSKTPRSWGYEGGFKTITLMVQMSWDILLRRSIAYLIQSYIHTLEELEDTGILTLWQTLISGVFISPTLDGSYTPLLISSAKVFGHPSGLLPWWLWCFPPPTTKSRKCMTQGTRMIINYRVLRTLHELCIHYSSSPASWGYPRGNPMGLNLHRCCCRQQWGLNDLLFHGSPPAIYINFASEVLRSAVRPYKLGEKSSCMNDYSVTILIVTCICLHMYCTCCFFSGVQFLQFPSPLSKMGAMPQIPHIPAFQSLAVMASKAKYPS